MTTFALAKMALSNEKGYKLRPQVCLVGLDPNMMGVQELISLGLFPTQDPSVKNRHASQFLPKRLCDPVF
jgi:hypothetical protein